MSDLDVARLIRFWMRKVRDLRVKLCRADALVEQLEAENTELQFQLVIAWQENADLKAELGRSEDRRYQP